MSGRVHKSLLNAEVNLVFYFLSLFLTFFSRKIFLNCLGAEFIGLTGTLNNILGYLNLAELGIGSCISFFLYKPLQLNNRQEIEEILSVFGYLYQWIGTIILCCGVVVSLFFPIMFSNINLGLGIVYFSFYSFLGSSLIGYFINYRQILLTADQKNYIVAIYMQSASLFKTALQIFLAYYYQNLYFWVAIEFLFSILSCIILNLKINKEYVWLKSNKSNGKDLLKKYPSILTNTRQVFIHRIKDFILVRSDELFIFAFVSLKMVAYYGNYIIIVSKLSQLFSSVFDSIGAGVGNLIAEGNKNHIMKVFWELITIRHFIAGIMCFSIYKYIEPFISLWLGAEYILDRNILLLLSLYIYIASSRGVVDMFNHALGHYSDTWSAWTELFLNVIITLVAGYYWGIAGILLGKVVSSLLIIVMWKPYYLFNSGFHKSYVSYWQGALRNYLVSIASFIVANYLAALTPIDPYNSFLTWGGYCFVVSFGYLLINIMLIILFCPGAKDGVKHISFIIKQK